MSRRIVARQVVSGEDETALLAFIDENLTPFITIPLYVLQEKARDHGPKAARDYIVEVLTAKLGELTPDELATALQP
jgi:hypothetical protein